MKRLLSLVFKIVRCIVLVAGTIFMLMAILAFTRIPFDMHRYLGEKNASFYFEPSTIIMLGGSGMPSESNLIRLYYLTHLSEIYPKSEIILAHPLDSSVAFSMGSFLIKSGVDSSRINYMMDGTNTREQALKLSVFKFGIKNEKVVVVTSPENMFRTLSVFRKIGFKKCGGVSAFENAMFVDLKYDHKKVGGKSFTPDVSGSIDLRYNFWNYFKLEITCMREYVAILYYKLNGWM